MSQIVDEVIAANKKYASGFGAKKDLALPPARGFAILCVKMETESSVLIRPLIATSCSRGWPQVPRRMFCSCRAAAGIRTLDPNLGKLVLHFLVRLRRCSKVTSQGARPRKFGG
jgi:hypothetical protein